MTDPIRLLLADDHEIFRDGFKAMLRKQPAIKLIAEAGDGLELIRLAEELKPDVIITDIRMPNLDGLEATRRIVSGNPAVRIIALSMMEEREAILDMLDAGAKGYLLKNAHKNEIIRAINKVYGNEEFFCEGTLSRIAQDLASLQDSRGLPRNTVPDLSDRDVEVIRYICKELTNKEIADAMNLSVRTIEGYRERIQAKLNARNSVGIVVYAIRHKIFS